MKTYSFSLPLSDSDIKKLKAGDKVLLSGALYNARDAAHKRIINALESGQDLPFDINGQTIYYMGPSPARAGQVIGSAGPTTSARMDRYAPQMIKAGAKVMIGKGNRSEEVISAIKEHGGIYFAAIGGAGALLSKKIVKAEIVAYEDLGAEAIRKLEIKDFPAIVAVDSYGGDIFKQGKEAYANK